MKGGKAKKPSPGQMSLSWDKQQVTESTEVHEVAAKFIQANCLKPPVPGIGFLNVDSFVENEVEINVYKIPKALDVTLYISAREKVKRT